ncbi:DUF4159 domain-containing protein [uncultured Rhodoblastus sp.]|uniref:DUF4159 domain-containing protein n=1 Tax=uncultured Rhodoblastus sp. TaxID=543037 RepID=UPI0025F0B112|nr:DUF4159 domain-containing protein [uncultured Rhodoblastus sp.]
MSFFPLAFTAPWVLLALAGAPLLYLLLRVTPPPPQRVAFPPLKLILDQKKPDATPARTPLWLLLLRLVLAVLVVFAMAGPVFAPAGAPSAGKGPLLLLIDDFWTAAPDWSSRVGAVEARLEEAGRLGQPAAVLALSETAAPRLQEVSAALAQARAVAPKAFLPARAPALPKIAQFLNAHPTAHVVWLSDGLTGCDGEVFARELAVLAPEAEVLNDLRAVRALAGADNRAATMEVLLRRSAATGPAEGKIRAFDARGASLGEVGFTFAGLEAAAHFDLPTPLRNEIARLDIAFENSAGATFLLDAGARRRRVGLVSGGAVEQPFLSPLHYLRDALKPFADLREPKAGDPDAIAHLIDEGVDVLILADAQVGGPETREKLDAYLRSGGAILRFAGPRLAAGGDDFLPVRLRGGGRTLGGALSWDRPKPLAPFDETSPFFGLTPPAEATVSRQILAEPEEGLPAKTWARLADGTPLVTAEKRGSGSLILFHVSADANWSNLPLSGLFVDMLRKIVDRAGIVGKLGASGEAAAQSAAYLPPLRMLDGFGALVAPAATVKPLPGAGVVVPDGDHPAGLYGAPDAPRALNAASKETPLAPLDFAATGLKRTELAGPRPLDLRPPLLIAAFVLALADALATLLLGGRWRRRAGPALAGLALAVLFGAGPPPATAETPPSRAETVEKIPQADIDAALTTKLAYIVTGDARADRISREGLTSLSEVLSNRTALVPGAPRGVDPARDDLSFYPLIYWPIAPERPQPGAAVAKRIGAYMKQGGLVLFDTRDAGMQVEGGPRTPAQNWLRRFLADIDLPPLEPAPRDHVVNRTFYILDGFVGRTTGGPTYIEALPPETDAANRPVRAGDGVSPIIVASNDLAAAWAGNAYGEALYPLDPGGPRQREMALRAGVNIVMYTLTGNYKADQVHVHELLERLGH